MPNKKVFYILIVVILILLLINKVEFTDTNDQLVIFVIDSRISPDVINNKPIVHGNEISHGSIVTRLIKKEVSGVDVIPLEVSFGEGISEELYFSSLRRIINYKLKNPEKEVLVNISLSFDSYQDLHHSLVKKLDQLGVLIITAAGNSNSKIYPYPAGFKETVAVASASVDGKESHSNYGDFIDISAPGGLEETFRIYYAGGLKYNSIKTSGTSFSAPRVTGLVAKILTMNNSYTARDAFKYLLTQTNSINDRLYEDGLLGAGVISKQKVLLDLDPLYFMKETSFLILCIFIFLLVFLWYKHGVVSIFLTLLIILAVIPIFLLIEEVIYYINNDGIQGITIAVLAIIALLLLLPVFLKWLKRYKLRIYLKKTYKPSIDHLINLVKEDEGLFEIVKQYYKNNSKDYSYLIDSFKKVDLDNKKFIKEIFLANNNSAELVSKLFVLLKDDSNSVNTDTKIFILEIFEEIGEKEVVSADAIQKYIKGIILSPKGDMWLRYQALRTFYYREREKDKLLPILKGLLNDRDELIRMEADGLLKEYYGGDVNYE